MCNKGITQFCLPPIHEPTCLYSPAARHHRPLAGTHCTYPQRDGQAELTWVAGYIEMNVPHRELNRDTVTHLSSNWVRRSLTSLIDTNALLLCQTTTIYETHVRCCTCQGDNRILIDPTQPGSSRLIIQAVNRSDAGAYTCSAVNSAGSSVYNVMLVVECKHFAVCCMLVFAAVLKCKLRM